VKAKAKHRATDAEAARAARARRVTRADIDKDARRARRKMNQTLLVEQAGDSVSSIQALATETRPEEVGSSTASVSSSGSVAGSAGGAAGAGGGAGAGGAAAGVVDFLSRWQGFLPEVSELHDWHSPGGDRGTLCEAVDVRLRARALNRVQALAAAGAAAMRRKTNLPRSGSTEKGLRKKGGAKSGLSDGAGGAGGTQVSTPQLEARNRKAKGKGKGKGKGEGEGSGPEESAEEGQGAEKSLLESLDAAAEAGEDIYDVADVIRRICSSLETTKRGYRHVKSRVLSELGRDADGVLTDDEKEVLTNAMLMAHEWAMEQTENFRSTSDLGGGEGAFF
jgi:hypothetical protein